MNGGSADASRPIAPQQANGIDCALFRVDQEPQSCVDGAAEDVCHVYEDAGLPCVQSLSEVRAWTCPSSEVQRSYDRRHRKVCNVCGGVNIAFDYGWGGEAAYSFDPDGRFVGYYGGWPRGQVRD